MVKTQKESAKNNFLKIFRPWDNISDVNSSEQDATISTTSQEDLQTGYDATISTSTTQDDAETGYASSIERDNSSVEVSDDSNCSHFNQSERQEKREIEVNYKTKHEKNAPKLVRGKRESVENKSVKHKSSTSKLETPFNSEYPLAAYDPYPVCPDLMQANLAQSLGLSPNDTMFLESMAQSYAMEEYARILSQEQQAKILNGKKQRPKKYKCPHCDVGFSNNGQLKGHIRIHTGERPFQCDEKNCGKTFTRNEELTRHKRIHSGLRPFACTQCGKRFGRKDHLKKHTRTHLQQRTQGLYAVPVMFPVDPWTASAYSYLPPVYGY